MNKFLLTIYKLNEDGKRIEVLSFNIVDSNDVQINRNYYELLYFKHHISEFQDYDLEPLTKERINRLINLHEQKKNKILSELASTESLLMQLNNIKRVCEK